MTDFHQLSKHEMYVVDFKTSHLYSFFVSQPGHFSRGHYLQTQEVAQIGPSYRRTRGSLCGRPSDQTDSTIDQWLAI